MDINETCLNCSVIVEWLSPQGTATRKITNKNGTLRLIRNESRQMYVEITTKKSAPVRLLLKGFQVHNKFVGEGKASIKFQESGCIIYISNAPPGYLQTFLKTLFVKMTGEKKSVKEVPLRTQLLSNRKGTFNEISPVTTAELVEAHKKVSKKTDTTPSPLSRKRKLSGDGRNPKRLLQSTTLSFSEQLNSEQKEILDACLSGVNVFFTGSAGTGKSYLLRKIISALPPDDTVATASTGVAACHIGGTTLHQFAGIGGGDVTLEKAYSLALKPHIATNWRRCKHLIIDEISMIDGEFFEKIESVARRVRNNDKPFGGIQLILCGDFFQLPPVRKFEKFNSKSNDKKFCFQTPAWNKCVQRTFELTIVHRQSDPRFVEMLNRIRLGKITDEMTKILIGTSKQKIEQDGILATRLCSHTHDANTINDSKLNLLPGEEKVFQAQDSDNASSKQLDAQVPVPGRLVLKVGAQVMLLKNINVSDGLVNGARGVVKDFKDGLPVVRFRNNREHVARHEKWAIRTASGHVIFRKQVPLKLAWAFSIHKSQGLTLDCVEMSLARVFEAGQAYVALSRAQSLETLRILDFKATQVWADESVLKFYRKLKEDMQVYRLFALGGNRNSQDDPKAKRSRTVNKKLLFEKPIVNIG